MWTTAMPAIAVEAVEGVRFSASDQASYTIGRPIRAISGLNNGLQSPFHSVA